MGMNLVLAGAPEGYPEGDEFETDLCTNYGYVLLCEWINTLHMHYPVLYRLSLSGEAGPTDQLAWELNDAMEKNPPADSDTFHVADRLADLLGAGRASETAAVVF
jgi:hypothetical protein